MSNNGILKLSISELAQLIKTKQVSPVEVTEAALAQADRLQPSLNSFITILHDQAMEDARDKESLLSQGQYLGPLHGIPIGIKDNIAVVGVRTTVGSKVLADQVSESDAHTVALCRQAGAIILGKENLEEFAAGTTSNNPHFGAVHNPWALDHVPGGSSGGGGANVAAGVTFASLGTDLGGSVRIPASYCGVVGLKQTYGRVSQRGLQVTSFNGDHIGPITRSVEDSALLLQVLAGHDPQDPSTVPVPVPDFTAELNNGIRGLRMGIPSNYYFDYLNPEVEGVVREAISGLEALGAEVREVDLPVMRYAGALRIVLMTDALVTHEPHILQGRDEYGPDTLYLALAGQFILARDYSKALKVQRLIKEEHARVLQEVDCLVAPTVPGTAHRIDAENVTLGGQQFRVRGPGAGIMGRYTRPFNATGFPAISIPCGFAGDGLPVGLQLICRPFEEGLLLRVASAYEGVSPGKGRWPAIADD